MNMKINQREIPSCKINKLLVPDDNKPWNLIEGTQTFEGNPSYSDIVYNKLDKENNKSKLGDCYISFYLNKIVTIRDKDWGDLKDFFVIPDDITEIDTKPIFLKEKPDICNPLKADIDNKENKSLFDYIVK